MIRLIRECYLFIGGETVEKAFDKYDGCNQSLLTIYHKCLLVFGFLENQIPKKEILIFGIPITFEILDEL